MDGFELARSIRLTPSLSRLFLQLASREHPLLVDIESPTAVLDCCAVTLQTMLCNFKRKLQLQSPGGKIIHAT